MELRQYRDVTNNQYEITTNKFKTVFNSDSFTDEERAKLKNNIILVNITFIIYMNGDSGGSWFFDYDKFTLDVPCNSIQKNIESLLVSVLESIGNDFS